MSSKKSSQDFGRDEMTALLGGTISDTLLSSTTAGVPKTTTSARSKQHAATSDAVDVSDLTVAETAALLKKQDAEKAAQAAASSGAAQRWRAAPKRLPARHALLQELEQSQVEEKYEQQEIGDGEEEEKDDEFEVSRARAKRTKAEPQIVVRRARPPERKRRRHDDDESSSESESSSSERPHRRSRHDSSSSEDDDDSVDERRQRLLARKRQQQRAAQDGLIETTPADQQVELSASRQAVETPESVQGSKPEPSSSSSESSSSQEESSSSPESSDEDDVPPPPALAKPLFVPKHKRNKLTSEQAELEKQEELDRKRQEEMEKRQMESRALVAQVVAADAGRGAAGSNEEVLDESGGATNPIPDDRDPTDPTERERERDAWEVRELQRLLNAQDLLEEQEEERREYERRKQMTDEERMREDELVGLYKRPGSARQPKEGENHFMQRFYHRGAFYMDEEEWDENDVRHKAREYARAATGEDKIDKRNLPEVMQVKAFGFARQSTKYKGLAKEDTTDRKTEFLPIVKKSKNRR